MNNMTQLTSANDYNVDRLIFSKANKYTIQNSVPTISYKRINISTKNEDGSVGELVLQTPRLYSFGVSENRNPTTQELTGYSLSLCLWNRDGPSSEEKQWVETFNNIVDATKKYLLLNRKEIGMKYDFDESDLKRFNPIFWKRDKETGEVLPDAQPKLFPRLIDSKKSGGIKVLTKFWDATSTCDQEFDPMDLMGKRMWVECAVKIESVFIGSQVISLQVKLWEVSVTLVESGMKRLLLAKRAPEDIDESYLDNEELVVREESDGSIKDSESESEEEIPIKRALPARRGRVRAQ